MILRHPHIFGDGSVRGSDDVLRNWEQIKRDEKGIDDRATVLKKVPSNLPALMRAFKVQQKAADAGFDGDDIQPVFAKVNEELGEVEAAIDAREAAAVAQAAADAQNIAEARSVEAQSAAVEEEIGDLIFAAVNLSRFAKVHPELALTSATEKFIRRFDEMEQLMRADGRAFEGMSLAEMDVYWEKVKG
jgi:tetrapyrrole methylase family protein/MazG family protein